MLQRREACQPNCTFCELLAFYDFPAKHWQSIRTTNPIESTFATFVFGAFLLALYLARNLLMGPLAIDSNARGNGIDPT